MKNYYIDTNFYYNVIYNKLILKYDKGKTIIKYKNYKNIFLKVILLIIYYIHSLFHKTFVSTPVLYEICYKFRNNQKLLKKMLCKILKRDKLIVIENFNFEEEDLRELKENNYIVGEKLVQKKITLESNFFTPIFLSIFSILFEGISIEIQEINEGAYMIFIGILKKFLDDKADEKFEGAVKFAIEKAYSDDSTSKIEKYVLDEYKKIISPLYEEIKKNIEAISINENEKESILKIINDYEKMDVKNSSFCMRFILKKHNNIFDKNYFITNFSFLKEYGYNDLQIDRIYNMFNEYFVNGKGFEKNDIEDFLIIPKLNDGYLLTCEKKLMESLSEENQKFLNFFIKY